MSKDSFATKYPRVDERLYKFGYAQKTEYTITEAQMILGENPSWVRKMVTGYRGKDKKANPMLAARKDDAGVWRIGVSSLELRLAETFKARQLREARFEDPTQFTDYRTDNNEKAIKRVARIAAEGLTPEESKQLRALLEKMTASEK